MPTGWHDRHTGTTVQTDCTNGDNSRRGFAVKKKKKSGEGDPDMRNTI